MGGLKQKPKAYDFLMAVDYAICHGPVAHFNQIEFRDKPGWVGPAPIDGSTYISKPDLFGGDDGGEGGVEGTVEFYRGGWSQRMSSSLARRFGLTPETAPGYRGIAHLFFHGARPHGGSMVRQDFDVPIFSNYSGAFGDPALYASMVFENPSDYSDEVFWYDSIDSGLVKLRMWLKLVNPNPGYDYVRAGGVAAECRDAAGNILEYQAAGSPPFAEISTSEKLTVAYLEFDVPPGTREIRYRAGCTRPVDEIQLSRLEVEAYPGALVNHFGSAFEYADLDTGRNVGFKWSTSNPYYQAPKVSLTCAWDGLSDLEGVEPLIWPIIGNENGSYQLGSMESAFERETSDNTKSFWTRIGTALAEAIFGAEYSRTSRYKNEKCNKTHLPNANPACMVYSAMTNSDWGKGDPASAFDRESYAKAARTLKEEHFGLSMFWNGQDDIENFVGEILDHIKGMQFQHPKTGLWTLKLLRDDYDRESCPVFDASNCVVTNVKTRLWGETINEVKVEYTCPASEEVESVQAQNSVNIAIQGGVLSETRNYHGIRDPYLAEIVAMRDVTEASATLTSCDVQVARGDGDIIPGDVIYLDWPRHGVSGYFRVGEVNSGSSKSKHVVLTVTEDIFSVQTLQRPATPIPLPVDPELVAPEAPDTPFVMSAPFVSLINTEYGDIEFPLNRLVATCADSEREYASIDAYGFLTDSTGAETFGKLRHIAPLYPAQLNVALPAEAESNIPALVIEDACGLNVRSGKWLVIGSSENDHELAMVVGYDGATDTYRVQRGLHDTLPRAHAASTLIWDGDWVKSPQLNGVYTSGDEVTLTFLASTLFFRQEATAGTEVSHPVQERASAPLRPASVSIDGNGFGDTAYLAGAIPASLTLTWANRNRAFEDSVVPSWTDGNIAPEVGQTTTVRFWGGDSFDVLEHEVSGITGTELLVDTTDLPNFRFYQVEFASVRDGIESYRAARRNLEIERTGYGNNYGFDYGQNDGE